MWCCVIKRAAKDSNASIFRVQVTLNMEALPSSKTPGITSQKHITSQNTAIFKTLFILHHFHWTEGEIKLDQK